MKRGPAAKAPAGGGPGLEALERQRWHLWIFAALMVVSLAAGMVLLTFENAFLRRLAFLPVPAIRVLFVTLAGAIGLYVLSSESRLRRAIGLLLEERARSEAMREQVLGLSRLIEVGKAINRLGETKEVLALILASALELSGAESGAVMLRDGPGVPLEVAASVPEGKAVDEDVAAWVAEHRSPYVVAPANPGSPRAVAAVPLVSQDRLAGVLSVDRAPDEGPFGDREVKLLSLFGEQAMTAIGNARLFERERRMVTRLEEVDQVKTDFIATVSHDLRTPLSAMIASARTLRSKYEVMTPEQRTELLEMVERQGAKQLRLIGEILSAAKIDSGGPVLKREPVDLAEVASRTVRGFEASGVATVALESTGSVVAFGDAGALDQVLSNLIDNAVKYSPPGSPVRVVVREQPGQAVLEVADRGAGIPEEMVPMIFERFRQVEGSAKGASGVGLGLYIVKNLVEAQGGTVSVTSREGVGSTFTLKLPKRMET